MQIFRRALLVAIATFSLFFFILDLYYSQHSFKGRLERWYHRSKRVIGLS
jgi:hypothetical protein